MDLSKVKGRKDYGCSEYHDICCCSPSDSRDYEVNGRVLTVEKCVCELGRSPYPDFRARRGSQTQNRQHLVHSLGHLGVQMRDRRRPVESDEGKVLSGGLQRQYRTR